MDAQSLSSLCDDFYVDLYVNTELELPCARDTVLTFFERFQRQFPSLGRFYRRQDQEFCLEEDSGSGPTRWVTLERDRLCSGWINPSSLEEAYGQHQLVLELMPYMLGVNHLDIESLDVCYAMDFLCPGSHDEAIAEALFAGTAFASLLDYPMAKPVGFSPAAIVALSEDIHTQARVAVDSKTSVYEGNGRRLGSDEAITVSLTMRQFPSADQRFDCQANFKQLYQLSESFLADRIVPYFVQPLIEAIAQRRSG